MLFRSSWCFIWKFQRLIHNSNPPSKVWNFIFVFKIFLWMRIIFQTIKLSLNGLVIFISLKKNDISGNNKILVYLIIQTVCLGVFFVPQENAFSASSTKLVSLLLWNQGITGGTKNLRCLTEGRWPNHISCGVLLSKSFEGLLFLK